MNLNDNKNEFEIMDNGNMAYQPRYPLANAPGSELQAMNYKDWIDMYERSTNGNMLLQNMGATLGVALAVTAFILSVSFPVASAAVGIVSLLMPMYWPSSSGNSQDVWKNFMDSAEALMDQKIAYQKRQSAVLQLQVVQSRLKDYQQAVCNLKRDPNNENYKSLVRDAFDDADDSLKEIMINFGAESDEVLLLNSYAQAANLHLLLLRDVVKFGRDWGMKELQVEQYYDNPPNRPGNPGMVQLLAIYTDHCTRWYQEGAQVQYNTLDWNKFNDYRRDMTIMVLDIVSIWPTYDPFYYEYPAKIQLTRKVYTRVFGEYPKNRIDEVEWMVPTPRLFLWLDKLTFYRRNEELGQYAGITQRFKTTFDSQSLDYTQGMQTDLFDVVEINSGQINNRLSLNGVWKTSNVLGQYSGAATVQTFSFYLLQSEDPYNPITLGNVYNTISNTTYGLPCSTNTTGCTSNPCEPCNLSTSQESVCDIPGRITHTLATVNCGGWYENLRYFAYSWAHISVTVNNVITPSKTITQIPAVKAYNTTGNVISGTQSTGGDLVELPANSSLQMILTHLPGDKISGYRMRIRYAAKQPVTILVGHSSDFGEKLSSFELPATYSGGSLTYNAFGYKETLTILSQQVEYIGFVGFRSTNATVIIDKIEFIPIEGSVEEYEANQDVEKARKAVNALFTNDAKNALKLNVTDYAVVQAANLVECVSDEFHTQEKMILLDQVKFAKRLSQARNLLNYGDFESSDWSGENGWRTSHHVHVASDNPIFKGHYLHMPGAMSPQFSNNVYPTYAYQKVDESKLKSYTRYLVRGFVGNSKDLELLVERYGKDVHVEMDVPNDIRYALPTNECGSFDRCRPASYQARTPHTCTCKDTTSMHTDCQCQNKVNRTSADMYTNGSPSRVMYADEFHSHQSCGCKNNDRYQNGTHPQKSCGCKDPHVFSYHIDTGCVDQEENLGLFFALKIASENGVANIDNLEIIEAQPLTGEALARVKKREQKWKQEMARKRLQTEKAVQAAQGAIQNLF
ncbi:hypothetical protein CN980_21465, partial [Bacillus cereus]